MKRTITVKGVGTVSAKPDYIIISMNLISKDPEYSKSVENATERIELLQEAVVKAGFLREDLKTLSFNVQTVYRNERDKDNIWTSVFDGYECSYRLKLAMDMDNKRLSDTLTEIANSKADVELSIEFTVKNPENIADELLRSAAENAHRKAKVLCEASGRKLGELLSIDYNWNEVRFVSATNFAAAKMVCEESADCGVPEFEPEDIRSQDSATFVWEID